MERTHPEIAEGFIDSVIMNYGNAGFLCKLPLDWDRFRASQFYETCVTKYTKDAVERRITQATTKVAELNNKLDTVTPNLDLVIREYVNAGLAVGLSPDWDRFRASEFYGACVNLFTKEKVEGGIAYAKNATDPLNKTLGELGFGNK